MPYAGGGAELSGATKRVTVRWTAEFEKTVIVPVELSLEPVLLEEYLGVSGDLFHLGAIEEDMVMETVKVLKAREE